MQGPLVTNNFLYKAAQTPLPVVFCSLDGVTEPSAWLSTPSLNGYLVWNWLLYLSAAAPRSTNTVCVKWSFL